jgi:hypothetical protein
MFFAIPQTLFTLKFICCGYKYIVTEPSYTAQTEIVFIPGFSLNIRGTET